MCSHLISSGLNAARGRSTPQARRGGLPWLLAMMLGWLLLLSPQAQAIEPNQGPGGPILVITAGAGAPGFGSYYAEILRTEGFNAFDVAELASVSAATLAAHDVVILAKTTLTPAQVSLFNTWVNGGGHLIAMAPDAQLASLLGLTATGGTLSEAYLKVEAGSAPGNGIAEQTLQFHGVADLYLPQGASTLASLYSSPSTAAGYPALTLKAVGSGSAAAFTFDLASSIVYTRQGNPAWAAQERDGYAPIRSDDKFFGNAVGDVKPDWIDASKIAIPQADEQQRLLANLIHEMNGATRPLPRFWYFPNGHRAVVVMTGDDHGSGGTIGRFQSFVEASPAGCSVADWTCVRGTSYAYPDSPFSDAQAAQYQALGFEIGVHINTGCADYTLSSLQATYATQIAQFNATYPSISALKTQRHHCVVWSDWTSGAEVQLQHGIRLDTDYYYWPPGWVQDVPGLFNGTAMPMRFAKLDGSLIDVFMAPTQMTDESGQSYPFTADTLLDRALGSTGYYGAYVVNAHTDSAFSSVANAVVYAAQWRGVPVISAQQLLQWLDGRNASSFQNIAYSGGVLAFTVAKDPAANGLQALLPVRSGNRLLSTLTRGGAAVPFTTKVVKGLEYVVFPADAGTYSASYGADTTGPGVSSVSPTAGGSAVSLASPLSVSFSEAMTVSSLNSATLTLQSAAGTSVPLSISYDPVTRVATLQPQAPLSASTVYTAAVRGGSAEPRVKDASGNPLAASFSWSFTSASVGSAAQCPCNAWTASTTPATVQTNDPNAVELGVKFTTDVAGYVTGVRFYKGAGNTGAHMGSLWRASDGVRLASAPFTAETASGWQQVDFTTPVAVTANTVYVASYFAPAGNYAVDPAYFANSGVDNGPVHLLKNGVNGGNGVFQYASNSTYPSGSYNASNYWVDLVFTGSLPADTTPPQVTSVAPLPSATSVPVSSHLTATFSEAMLASSIGASSFELRSAANALVPAVVSYDAVTRTATLQPTAALAAGASYTATVKGGTTAPFVTDQAGNALAASVSWSFTTAVPTGVCAAPPNAIVAENCLVGNASGEWDITGTGDASIQGFATDISVNRGSTVSFKVKTTATAYRFDIYRLGYYGGLGARKVASVQPTASLPQTQPACLTDAATGLIDCGNWGVSGSWAVPADAVSGLYIAKLIRTDTGGASHIAFIVRNDASTAKLLFQTSDTTWQAYNDWGGNSLYTGPAPAGRAYKVSYNRPFATRAVDNGQDWLFNAEYPMLRWLEANGYDTTYATGLDSDRYGNLLLNHKVFMSVGHDEYWSGGQRDAVTAARAANVNLAFFSGNEVFWKTRWEPSIDGSATPNRTLVSYKETHADAKIDPTSTWTGTWRDARFSPPSDGGRPENELTGAFYMVNQGATTAIQVPAAEGKLRFWRNTSVANLAANTVATLTDSTLGYEWDIDADHPSRPPGLMRLSSTTVNGAPVLQDQGSTYASGTANHALTLYRHSSGARVFSAGSVQWAWGLDAVHDRAGPAEDVRIRQATVNLLADMGVQPGNLQAPLVAASASTDTLAPASVITAPAAGASLPAGTPVTVSGTATDTGGGVVAGMEVSTDNGTTWHPATGRGSWSYAWTPTGAGAVTLRTRAVDDSGNIETPAAGRGVTISSRACPCTLFAASAAPVLVSAADYTAVNLGMRFTVDEPGKITGIRFYKSSGNTGTHIGTLWSASGQVLASATFTGETASGWQQVNFATPVTVTANTVYVASYLAPQGRYAADQNVFAAAGIDAPPLHALKDGAQGANGLFKYGSGSLFPNETWKSTNYWVDVVFTR